MNKKPRQFIAAFAATLLLFAPGMIMLTFFSGVFHMHAARLTVGIVLTWPITLPIFLKALRYLHRDLPREDR